MLPYEFKNGSRVEDLTTCCSKCKKEIEPENIKTDLIVYNNSVAMNAYAICFHGCQLITPIEMRFADDGTFLVKTENGWKPGRYTNSKPAGWLGKMKSMVGWR